MARPKTLDESLRLWDEMANWDLMAAALEEITSEATQTDSSSPATLWYECSDRKIQDECNNMLATIRSEELIRSQVWYTAGMGNSFEKLDYSKEDGVTGMSFVHPFDVRRYWLKRNRACVGFKILGDDPLADDAEIGDKKFGRATMPSATADKPTKLWYPWEVLHFRRMYQSRLSENGEPLFEHASGIYKKLRLALDQMSVHRAQIQPDRYLVNIDVKDASPAEQYNIVNRWKNALRTKLSFGTGASGVSGQPDAHSAYYNAWGLDSILWMAQPRDSQHSITKIGGTASVPDVQDIELLTNLFFSIIGMPKGWIGVGAAGGEGQGPVSGKALLAQDMKFLRKIKSLRAPVINGYEWLAYFHCLLKGLDTSAVQIRPKMTPIGGLEEQIKMELLDKQADIMGKLAGVFKDYDLPREAWIELVFAKYLNMPKDVVDLLLTSLPADTAATLESASNDGVNWRKKINEAIANRLGPDRDGERQQMLAMLDGRQVEPIVKRFRTPESILRHQALVPKDVIVNGYGQMNSNEIISSAQVSPTVFDKLTESRRKALDKHINRL